MAKMSITFNGFDDLAYAIDKAEGDLTSAVDEALNETQETIRSNLLPAAAIYDRKGKKGYATGKMYKAIISSDPVHWEGSVAYVKTGFTTNKGLTKLGFMHSIFIMYGTPRIKKDTAIYNAIRGTRTKRDIANVQEEIMKKHLKLTLGE